MLAGKRILVTGVLTNESIAWSTAAMAQELGAEVILTSFGRARRITERASRMLPTEAEVLELDVRESDHFPALASELEDRWGTVDGVLHAIAYAPPEAFGKDWLAAEWSAVAEAIRISAFSFSELTRALAPLLEREEGTSALVTLAVEPDHWRPQYGWMGPSKAMLISLTRYLATSFGDRGIRANVVACGPIETVGAQGVPTFEKSAEVYDSLTALGWDPTDAGLVAGPICFLLSDYARGITGAVLDVDAGFPQFEPLVASPAQ